MSLLFSSFFIILITSGLILRLLTMLLFIKKI